MTQLFVSPHLDDVALSVGAVVHSLARRGPVVVATAFAGNPRSDGPASFHDARRGCGTEAEATRVRREEDRAAMAELGATPMWGDFSDIAYVAARDPAAIRAFLGPLIDRADTVWLPGWPLTHADHAYVTNLVLAAWPEVPVAFYQEQPYATAPTALVRGWRGRQSHAMRHGAIPPIVWRSTRTGPADRAAKRRAVACYAAERSALGWSWMRAGWVDRFGRGETVGRFAAAAPLPASVVVGS